MKFKIYGAPRFTFDLTSCQIQMLMNCSAMHYDARCRVAGQCGEYGFIYGWNNLIPAWEHPNTTANVSASWKELDLALKIMENPIEKYKAAASELSKDFKFMLKSVPGWEQDGETKDTMNYIYEVMLPGFDGSTDETDHMIKWVWARSAKEVHELLQAVGYTCTAEIAAVGFLNEDAADYVLPKDAKQLQQDVLDAQAKLTESAP